MCCIQYYCGVLPCGCLSMSRGFNVDSGHAHEGCLERVLQGDALTNRLQHQTTLGGVRAPLASTLHQKPHPQPCVYQLPQSRRSEVGTRAMCRETILKLSSDVIVVSKA